MLSYLLLDISNWIESMMTMSALVVAEKGKIGRSWYLSMHHIGWDVFLDMILMETARTVNSANTRDMGQANETPATRTVCSPK